MKAQDVPLYAGDMPLDPLFYAAQEAGFIHRPNKESISILCGPDGKFKVFCIPCMRGKIPFCKSEYCGAKGEEYLCKTHRVKPDNTLATDYDEFLLSLIGYEMPVVRGCRFPYLEAREHWKCMHSDDPKFVIQGGGGIAKGIYYRRCDGVYKNLEGQTLVHDDCVESSNPKCIVQGRASITESMFWKHCSGAYISLAGGILTT